MKSSCLLIVVFSLLAIHLSAAQKKHIKYCHINQLMKCVDPLRRFTAIVNGTGIVTNEKEFDLFCGLNTKWIPKCMTKWTQKCGNRFHQEILEIAFIRPFKDSFIDFCNPNKPYKARFLRHSPCLHEKVKLSKSYREKCVQGIQVGFENMMNFTDAQQTFRSFCCVYNRWERCICDHLNEMCGPEAPQIIIDLIHHGTMKAIGQLCPMDVFVPESKKCTELMPPLYTKAKGSSSNAYLSYMFSYWCPNVGYGIIPERD